MTGYGRAQADTPIGQIVVEIRCCNHRYADFRVKMPRALAEQEARVTERLRADLQRGRVEVTVGLAAGDESASVEVQINESLARQYNEKARRLAQALGLLDEGVGLEYLLRMPDVLSLAEPAIDSGQAWRVLLPLVDSALQTVLAMRETEGAELCRDFHQRLGFIESRVAAVEAAAPELVRLYRDRLQNRVGELLGEIALEETRLANEVAFLAERSDITEEVVRLRSHIQQCRALVDEKEPNGRRIEFLLQEMLRETNTIGSKAGEVNIIDAVLAIKAELEKLREQVQNIE